jgi:DnaA family protein
MDTLLHPQLPLGFEPSELFTFESFVLGSNKVAVGLAQQAALGAGEKQLYFWGASALGKSHLLQAMCNLAAKNKRTVCYLTRAEMDTQASSVFDGLEQIDMICLDDVERWLQGDDWEMALFGLINRVRENNGSLIMASANPPDEAFVKLADLRSRLAWGPVFQLQGLSDTEKYQALRFRAQQSGLELPENVATYLMTRYPRDMFGLFERLAVLDKASMAMQRRLTIPLIKSVFSQE